MSRKVKITIMIVLLTVIALSLILIIKSKTADKNNNNLTTIQLNEVTRSIFYAPQYVAISNGFFEEEGLNIEITTGQRSRQSYDIYTSRAI